MTDGTEIRRSRRRPIVELVSADLDDDCETLRWVFHMEDDRLPDGAVYIHCATSQSGWGLRDISHTDIDGLCWLDADELQPGMPLNDDAVYLALHNAIQVEVERVALCALLLIRFPAPMVWKAP